MHECPDIYCNATGPDENVNHGVGCPVAIGLPPRLERSDGDDVVVQLQMRRSNFRALIEGIELGTSIETLKPITLQLVGPRNGKLEADAQSAFFHLLVHSPVGDVPEPVDAVQT